MERRVKLGDIEFSVVEEEKPRDMVTITDHQVEKGQDVSDHVKQESSIIDIIGVIVGDDAAATLSKLQKHQKEGRISTYIGRNVYNNMAILTMDRNHGKEIANGFAYNIALKQVRISSAKEVELTVVSPVTKKASPQMATQVKPKTNNGKQQVKVKPISSVTTTGNTEVMKPISSIVLPGGKLDPLRSALNPGGTMKAINLIYKPKVRVGRKGESIS